MVSAAMSCVKYLLFVFNLFFAVTGIGILTVGFCLGSVSRYSSFMDDKFIYAPIVLIVVGVIIFVIAFFGCCGVFKENHCMVTTFASLLLFVLILEIAAGVAGYFYSGDIKKLVEEKMEYTLGNYESDKDVRRTWDMIQTDLHCCGVKGIEDWKSNIPSTCCSDIGTDDQCTVDKAYTEGCSNALQSFVEKNAVIFGGVGIGVAAIQLIGVIFACCLGRSIRKGYESV